MKNDHIAARSIMAANRRTAITPYEKFLEGVVAHLRQMPVWRRYGDEQPVANRKFVLLPVDGGGPELIQRDGEGEMWDSEGNDLIEEGVGIDPDCLWLYLPDDYGFWCDFPLEIALRDKQLHIEAQAVSIPADESIAALRRKLLETENEREELRDQLRKAGSLWALGLVISPAQVDLLKKLKGSSRGCLPLDGFDYMENRTVAALEKRGMLTISDGAASIADAGIAAVEAYMNRSARYKAEWDDHLQRSKQDYAQ